MRRIGWRLARNVVGLCLPTAVVVALSVFFYFDKVPEIEKAEANRVKAIYRETALSIQRDRSRLPPGPSRPKEWKPAGKMIPGRWGFSPIPMKRTTLVWYEEGTNVYVRGAAFVPQADYRLLFTVFGGFFLLVLVGATTFGIRYFVGYMKSRDDFLAATAHDLTTPLVGMRMTIGRDDDEAKKLNERMLLIVDNIKEFLKLGGRRAPEIRPVDVVALAKEAYRLFAADYEDAVSGPVAFHVPEDVCGERGLVAADETMMLQILWNLFGNDLKYAAPYGKVEVRFAREGRFVCVAFVDEGQGMAPAEMRRAFDRYYRAKTVLASGKGGFGIGLCAAREFARAMGGDLSVRANSPSGCIFTLSIPKKCVIG